MDDQVARRVYGPPGVFSGDVFDESCIAPAVLVKDLQLQSLGQARFHPGPFLLVAGRFGFAHVAEKAALLEVVEVDIDDIKGGVHILTIQVSNSFKGLSPRPNGQGETIGEAVTKRK